MFPPFLEDPALRRRNVFAYIDPRPRPVVRRCLETDGLGYEVFNVANADMSVAATTDEVRERFYDGVEVRREMGRDETFYSIEKGRRLLGYEPEHSGATCSTTGRRWSLSGPPPPRRRHDLPRARRPGPAARRPGAGPLPRRRARRGGLPPGHPGSLRQRGGVRDWVRTKRSVLVLGSKKSLSARPNGRSADFIAPSTSNGCAMACSYCYVPRRKGYANPVTVFCNIERILGYLERGTRVGRG